MFMNYSSELFKAQFPLGFFEEDIETEISGNESYVIGFKERTLNSIFSPLPDIKRINGFEVQEFLFEKFSGFENLQPNFIFDRDNAVKDIFDQMVDDLIIDQRWLRKLRMYVYGFATKNNDHAEFFGSPYLGTHRIIFKTSDKKEWFSEIIDVDEVMLRDNLIKTKWINKDFNVSSDAFNLSIVYLMHQVTQSSLSNSQKEEALIYLVMMFHYRILTSIMNHYYRYQVKQSVAETAYNKLSLKFDIKRYGSWTALFKARAEFIISKQTGIHYDTFMNMDDDKKIVYMVNDMESRLKGVVNDYTKVLYEIKDSVDLVQTDSGVTMVDEQLQIKDVQKNVTKFKNYIDNTITADKGFYKEELVTYAEKAIDRTPYDKFAFVIRNFPSHYNHKKGEKYREFVEDVTTHLFEYLAFNKIKQTDLKAVFLKIRGAYTSSKSTNPLLLKLRETGDQIVKEMTGIKTPIVMTSIRTSLMLYIVLRTLTMDKYK